VNRCRKVSDIRPGGPISFTFQLGLPLIGVPHTIRAFANRMGVPEINAVRKNEEPASLGKHSVLP
jgi:hypothetical protein